MFRFSPFSLLLFLAMPFNLKADGPAWGFGPPDLENQYPLALLHRSFSPRSPEVREEGSTTFSTHFAWTNTFIFEDTYVIDDETRYLDFKLAYVPLRDLEVSFSLPLYWRGGGELDSLIEDWHDFFGLPEGDRFRVPDDQFGYTGINQDGSGFSIARDGYSLGTAKLGTKYLLTKGSETSPAWALSLDLGLPTAKSTFGQESLDIIAGVVGSYRVESFSFYWGGAYVYYADDNIAGVKFESHHAEAFASAEYAITDSLAFLFSIYAHSKVIDDLKDHPDEVIYNDFVLMYRSEDSYQLELLVRENPGGGDGSADVTFGLGAKVFFS